MEQFRFDSNKYINLVDFLPSIYKETETEQFLQFFEDFLNNLYTGYEGAIVTNTDDVTVPLTTGGSYTLSANTSYSYNFLTSGILANTMWTVDSNTVSGALNTFISLSANNLIRKTSEPVWYTIESVGVSGDYITLTDIYSISGTTETTSANYLILNNKISILEKAKRISELHDPSLMDIEYIQYFANYMGYNIDINRSGLATANSDDEVNKYIRFVVSNLPNWYRIKTTNNAVKVLLYSFGIITDLLYYYTNGYSNTVSSNNIRDKYRYDYENIGGYDLRNLQGSYSTSISGETSVSGTNLTHGVRSFLTPHFAIKLYLDNANDALFAGNIEKQQNAIESILAIQPLNTVFHGFSAWVERILPIINTNIDISSKYFETVNQDKSILEDIDTPSFDRSIDISSKYFETINYYISGAGYNYKTLISDYTIPPNEMMNNMNYLCINPITITLPQA